MTKRAQQAADYAFEQWRDAVEQDQQVESRWQELLGRLSVAGAQDQSEQPDQEWSEMREEPDLPTMGDGSLPPGDA